MHYIIDNHTHYVSLLWLSVVPVLAVWELIWKGLGLWRAGHRNEKWWFIAILVINSVGILPIVYLLFFSQDQSKKK